MVLVFLCECVASCAQLGITFEDPSFVFSGGLICMCLFCLVGMLPPSCILTVIGRFLFLLFVLVLFLF